MADQIELDSSLENVTNYPNWSKDNFELIEPLTPTKNILERIQKCPPDKTPIILITTGAYCPIHKMHIEMHEIARKYIEDNFNAEVVGSLLSASHDEYLKAKLERKGEVKFWLDVYTRIKLINLAINDHCIVEQDLFEPLAPNFMTFIDIIRMRQSFFDWLCLKYKVRACKLLMLLGEDMLPYNLYPKFPMENLGLAVIQRKNNANSSPLNWPKISTEKQWEEKVFLIEHANDVDISSTLIRKSIAMKQYEGLATLLHPSVAAELRQLWNGSGKQQ
ncbi:hypothetical protein LOD99_3313 [Oopsacas minuta]|uniref:Cytidyltransferase-like domain-containing protein n=1 Tax=Oopsacas minuta TaxID=111878 RepID=A0AAV7JZ86_9METZ|nr:hypothetical protein LOD99_3313 [Oopsacas minuta]